MKYISLIMIIFLLSGCLASNVMISEYKTITSKMPIENISTKQLCSYKAYIQDNKIQYEIVTELGKRIPKEEKIKLNKHYIWIGMKEDLVYCVLGIPTNINSTINKHGTNKQMVYRLNQYKTIYIYTENGIVSSFQM